MIEIRHEVSITTRVRQIGCVSRSLVRTISESRTNYWASYVIDLACPFLFVHLGMRHQSNWPSIIVSCLSGLVVFSLIEYSIHRWLLHNPKSALFHLHETHHNFPEKPSAFLFPTSIVTTMLIWLFLTYALHFQSASFSFRTSRWVLLLWSSSPFGAHNADKPNSIPMVAEEMGGAQRASPS
jgi:hypothetical protein